MSETIPIRLEADNGYWCFENGRRIAWDVIADVFVHPPHYPPIDPYDWHPYEPEPLSPVKTHVIYKGT